jgi:hypothetical protein
MTKKPFINEVFAGGEATDKKIGIKYSFSKSQSIDFRSSPSQFTLLGRPTKEDNNAVVDLVQNEVMTNSGKIYGLGDKGYVYYRDTDGMWGNFGNIGSTGNVGSGAFGMLYRKDQSSVYLASDTSVSSITTVDTVPALNADYYGISKSTYNNNSNTPGLNVNSDQSGGTKTTLIKTSYVEGAMSDSRYFQTDIEPINKIGVRVVSKGTGDWTLTVHDGLGSLLATSTVTNANLVNNDWNYFVFSSQVRVNVAPAAQTYHFHLTSTVGDGTVYSTIANDLSTADMNLWADRLINTTNGMHPMDQIQQFVVIGNGRYLSVWEPLGDPDPSNAEWQRHYLQFPPEYEVCGITHNNEYLYIACEVVSDDPTQNPQGGVIFVWDGIQKASTQQNVTTGAYNYFIPIPEGSPYAIHSYKNVVYYNAGGAWYALASTDSQPQKIRTLPFGENGYNNNNNQTVVYPYAATTRNGIQLMAWPSITKNENIPYGVYSWGQTDTTLPNSFGYSYVLSTGSTRYSGANNLTIGMVKSFGDTLHISWRDDSNPTGDYGIDVVNSTSPLPLYATWESLIFDNGYVGKLKEADYMNATWLPLPDGVQIRLKYSIDRGDWQYSPYFSNSDPWFEGNPATYASFSIGQESQQARFNEIQVGIDVYSEEGIYETPTVTSITLIYDDLIDEALSNG